MLRKECLQQAIECVCIERQEDYGSPEDNFKLISSLWSVYLDYDLKPRDVAIMMALLKIARIQTGAKTADSYIDLAGYAAIAAELDPGAPCPEYLRKHED